MFPLCEKIDRHTKYIDRGQMRFFVTIQIKRIMPAIHGAVSGGTILVSYGENYHTGGCSGG